MNRSRLWALGAIFFTVVFWGLSFVSIKITLTVIPPMTLALLRFIIASGILFFVLKKAEPATRLTPRDWPLLGVSGLFGVTAYYYFQNNGVKLTTTADASIILAVIPILTVVGEFLVFKTRLSLLKIVSVCVSLAGVYLIVAVPQQQSAERFTGNVLMLGAAASWVIYTLVTRPLGSRYSQLAIVTYQTVFGTLALLPFAFFESWNWQAVDLSIMLHLLYLGVLCSALGYYLYVYAMGILGMSSVSLFINLIPVVSTIASFIILQEPVSTVQIAGGVMILGSVCVTDMGRKRTTSHKSAPGTVEHKT